MIDTHAHLFEKNFEGILEDALSNSKLSGIENIIIPATNLSNFQKSLNIAKAYHGYIYPTIGIHPTELIFDPNFALKYNAVKHMEILRDLCMKYEGIVKGIGECGLDYYWIYKQNITAPEKMITAQKDLLSMQIKLAYNLNLPVIIHLRDVNGEKRVYRDFLAIINTLIAKKEIRKDIKIQFHSFSAGKGFLERILYFENSYVSFTGNITYKNALKLREVLKQVPLERLLLETDSPYMTPEIKRGEINTPSNLPIILDRISEVREEARNLIEEVTTKNAKDLFNLNQILNTA